MKRLVTVFCLACFASLASETAYAGLFRAYLSVNGKDTNPCTVQQPCRLLPAALAAVNDGGEVWMLDSANFNASTVTIGKSVMILAVPGTVGSLVAPSGADGVVVANGANHVTLRNLVLRDLAGSALSGLHVTGGNALRVENCEIYGTSTGIRIDAAGAAVSIVNTTVHDVSTGIDVEAASNVLLDRLSTSNTSNSVNAQNGSHVTISNSVLGGPSYGVLAASATYGVVTVVNIAHTTITSAAGSGACAVGVASPPLGGVAEVFVQTSTIHADIGFQFSPSFDYIYSYGDNRLVYYAAPVSGGVLTPISGI